MIDMIIAADPTERMPPENDPLPKEQIATLRGWIDSGLRQNSGSVVTSTTSIGFTPTAMTNSMGPAALPSGLPAIARAKIVRAGIASSGLKG